MSNVQQRTGRPGQQKFFNKNYQNKNFNPNRKNFNNRFQANGTGQIQINGVAPKPNRDAIVRQNLQNLQQNAQKKRVAQERYYGFGKGQGRSPLVKQSGPFTKENNTYVNAKQNTRPFIKQENRPFIKQENRPFKQENRPFKQENRPFKHSVQERLSVQQRLGNRGKQNFQTSPKKAIFINTRPNTNKLAGGMRSDKIVRVQNVQQKRNRFPNTNGAIKTVNSAGKVVYLQPARKPANYTVRVDNDRKHHVTQGLNPVLQQEIKMIQNKTSRQIAAPPVHIQPAMQNVTTTSAFDDRLPIVATNRTLHERFSMI